MLDGIQRSFQDLSFFLISLEEIQRTVGTN